LNSSFNYITPLNHFTIKGYFLNFLFNKFPIGFKENKYKWRNKTSKNVYRPNIGIYIIMSMRIWLFMGVEEID